MKDTIAFARTFSSRGRAGVAGSEDLVRVGSREPCPKCDRAKKCFVTRDGAEVWCTKVSEGAALSRPNQLGDLFIHRLQGQERAHAAALAQRAAPPAGAAERSAPDDLDRVYRSLLGRLALEARDGAALEARGLPAALVARGLYCSMPERGRAALARAVLDDQGLERARRVPGIVYRTDPADPARGWWSLAGPVGIVVPVLDLEGRVVALKVRRRDPCEGPRYVYLSSAGAGGPAALAAVHVPAAARDLRASGRPLVITEGELKADVATALSGRPVVSLPGVANWRRGVELARAWGARVVVVAFDADARTNPDVARHQRDLLRALAADGFDARLWQWPPEAGKGLDDFLLARRDARPAPTGTRNDAR